MNSTDRLAAAADALVLFGMTGDLAQKKIFPALYAMAKSGALTMPVVGVASSPLSTAQLRERIERSLQQAGEIDDQAALERLFELTCYVSGDYNSPDTF